LACPKRRSTLSIHQAAHVAAIESAGGRDPGDRFAIAVIEGGAIRTRRHAGDLPQTKN
jgi:hypothetical protein